MAVRAAVELALELRDPALQQNALNEGIHGIRASAGLDVRDLLANVADLSPDRASAMRPLQSGGSILLPIGIRELEAPATLVCTRFETISKAEILRKLKQRFGGRIIRDLRFRVG